MSGAETPPADLSVVCAIVVNHRRPQLTIECLTSLEPALARLDRPTELIVVDNGSNDRSAELIGQRFPAARVLALAHNHGFATAVNAGLGESEGEWVLLLNNDATIDPGAVAVMLEAAEASADVGAIAAQMRFAEAPSVINSAGIGVDSLGVAYDRELGEPASSSPGPPVEVFGASGGAALLRRRMLDELGGFDASFYFALEDVDLAWRAQMAGWKALCVPAAVVWHHHGGTGAHASAFKNYHVGRNRIRVLAKNADGAQLRRHGVAIVLYELAYLAYAIAGDRTLAALRGRLRGLCEWRAYRRAGASARRPLELEPARGLRAALRRRAAWGHGSGSTPSVGAG